MGQRDWSAWGLVRSSYKTASHPRVGVERSAETLLHRQTAAQKRGNRKLRLEIINGCHFSRMCNKSAFNLKKTKKTQSPRPGRVLGRPVTAYLSCTFPWAGGVLQLCEGPQVWALGAGVGAALLGLGKSLRQAGLSYRLDLLQSLW